MNNLEASKKKYLTVTELVPLLNACEDTVRKMIKTGVLRGQRTSPRGKFLVSREAYIEFLKGSAN